MKAEYIERISADYLSNLFSSEQFIQTNIKAGKKTARTGHETGYKIFKPIGKDVAKFSRIFEGNSFSTEGIEDELEKNHKTIVSSFNIYPVVSAHFHPNFQLIPSPEDLFHAYVSKRTAGTIYGYDLNPINILGRAHNRIDLLLHQQKAPHIPEELGKQLMEDLYDYNFCNEYNEKLPDYPYKVAEKMRESGLYNATIIRIDNSGKIDFNLKEIEDFSFEAKKHPDYFEEIQSGL